eukprot:8434715-Alexandrium_andersonii.AAC.1
MPVVRGAVEERPCFPEGRTGCPGQGGSQRLQGTWGLLVCEGRADEVAVTGVLLGGGGCSAFGGCGPGSRGRGP